MDSEMHNVGSSNDTSPAEKRKSARKKSFLRGKIAYDRGAHSFDCIIRDISDTGARIDLPLDQIVPKQFVLIDMRTGNAYEVEVKWRKRSQFGLTFLRSFTLDGPLSADRRYLKHLWVSSFRGIDADAQSSAQSQRGRGESVESPARKSVDQTDVTPEMIGAGVTAYFLWKPPEFRRVYSEPDMVCAVYRAMIKAARRHARDQTQGESLVPTRE